MNDTTNSDLYAELQQDTSGKRRDELLARLQILQDTCKAARQKLNDRETFQRIEASAAAVTAAIKIVKAAAKNE